MSKAGRRRFSAEYEEQAVARLAAPDATHSSVARELGITASQLKSWRLEQEAVGSADAARRQKAETAELSELRRENRWVARRGGGHAQGVGFFRTMGGETMKAKLAFVAAHVGQHAIRLMCGTIGVAESWFHAWRRTAVQREARARARAEKAEKIRSIFTANKARYGSPRIHAELIAQGERISEKTVAKIMKENDIFVPKKRRRKPQTTDSRHDGPIAPNLLERNFDVAVPDRVYVADLTHVRTDEGWLYLAAVKDLATMEIVGWSMADTLHRKIVIEAMRLSASPTSLRGIGQRPMALENRRPASGLIRHSDRGSQYASGEYLELLHAWKVWPSMSGKGCCLDNAPPSAASCSHPLQGSEKRPSWPFLESFFGSLENEMVHRTRFRTRREAKAALFEYIAVFYNRQRRHSTIGYRTPEQARLDITQAMAA